MVGSQLHLGSAAAGVGLLPALPSPAAPPPPPCIAGEQPRPYRDLRSVLYMAAEQPGMSQDGHSHHHHHHPLHPLDPSSSSSSSSSLSPSTLLPSPLPSYHTASSDTALTSSPPLRHPFQARTGGGFSQATTNPHPATSSRMTPDPSGSSPSPSVSPVRSILSNPRRPMTPDRRSGTGQGEEQEDDPDGTADRSQSPSATPRHPRNRTNSTLLPPRPPYLQRKSSSPGSIAASSVKPRSISFKRRGNPGDSGFSGMGAAQKSNFGGYPRQSFAAASQAGSEALARWRNRRRTQTLSVRGPEGGDPEDPSSWTYPEPKIPSLLPNSSAPDATPIPLVPFTVLCLCCFSEFCSAGVAGPFLFFLIESFHVGGESDVGFYAGILSSCFFFAQFLTALLWASVADKYGRRAVLFASLGGTTLALTAFGTSSNLKMAIVVRLCQGLFAGSVGVAKGAVRDLTDPTNEGKAYAILGAAWGFGGILGPILGGVLEHPADKFPAIFGSVELCKTYPYLLPCMSGAAFTATGAFLCLFIGPDGGPRQGRIRLPGAEGDLNPVAATVEEIGNGIENLSREATKRISGYFSQSGSGDGVEGEASNSNISLEQTQHSNLIGGTPLSRTFTQEVDEETGGPPSPFEDSDDEGTIGRRSARNRRSDWDARLSSSAATGSNWRFSRTEERKRGIFGGGSAYGYEPSLGGGVAARRPSYASNNVTGPQAFARSQQAGRRIASNNSGAAAARYSVGASAMGSAFNYAPDFEAVGEDPSLVPAPRLNFAQRFLLANDDAVTSITDLWVAAAINGDDGYSVIEDDLDYDEADEDANESQAPEDSTFSEEEEEDDDNSLGEGDENVSSSRRSGQRGRRGSGPQDRRDASTGRAPYLPPVNFAQRRLSRAPDGNLLFPGRPRSMRLGSFGQPRIPSVYGNTGIELPATSHYDVFLPSPSGEAVRSPGGGQQGPNVPWPGNIKNSASGYDPTLAGIPEGSSARNTITPEERQRLAASTAQPAANVSGGEKVPPSLFALLPMTIIAHYGLLAFHSATFDQVFMAFLVTPFNSGGLGLTATHFAELIAAMAFCQIGFQFGVYPYLGPPRGPFSHLAMMRLGTMLYLPAYTLFPLLRNFLQPNTDALVMAFMILFASMRWMANICAFTAVSILMNALTPPNLVPLANGLAQTTSSASRFVGPLVGGVVWAKGIEGDWETHSWPFNYHEGFWFVGVVAFVGFLHCTIVLKSAPPP